MDKSEQIKSLIAEIPNFPKPGVLFRDITSLLDHPQGLRMAVQSMMDLTRDVEYDAIMGSQSRGFIFSAAMSYENGKPLILARKPGKLPRAVITAEYDLEYGKDSLQIHADSLKKGQRVLLVDDLMATGGTIKAMVELTEKSGAIVAGIVVLMELVDLKGREHLKGYPVFSCVKY